LANLLAAAVIYLIGQATGLLRSNTVLTLLSLLFVFSCAAGILAMTVNNVMKRRLDRFLIITGLISFSQVALLLGHDAKEPLHDVDRRFSLAFYIILALLVGILAGFSHARSFGKRARPDPSAVRVAGLYLAWSAVAALVVFTNTFGFHFPPFFRD
jgi:hypothetical protein